ncbi:MAG: Zn-ribbon domain-containing OB-fold protein [Rubrobacter sp.]|nr:Zn-ribbon domain-containing OB-fold protein [Rubrobacter sp.]
MTVPVDWSLHYDHSTGPVVARFLRGLEDGRIEGVRCPECGLVYLPPRAYCERDFVRATEWVGVGTEGVLEGFTIVTQKFGPLPDPPYTIAFVRLDGADTALVNFLRMPLDDVEEAASRLEIGATRVRARFHDSREARITDFHYELAE